MTLAPRSFTFQSQDGYRIHGWDHGGPGRPVVFCHCTGTLGRIWDPVVRRLGEAFRCIALDTRGHGDSEMPDHPESVEWSLSGRDILQAVDELGLEAPFAVGHSGGAAQVAYAEHFHPGVFGRVVLIDAIIGPPAARQGGQILAEKVRHRINTFANIEEARERFTAKPPMSRWHSEAVEAYLSHGFRASAEGIELKLKGSDEAEFYLRSGAAEVFAELENMPVKALLITGSDSDVRALAEAQHELLPHAELQVIADCGHFIPQEKPDETAAAIRAWFTS